MKARSIFAGAALLLVTAAGAHAGNEGPVGAPQPIRTGIVAEVTTNVGFAPPAMRGAFTVRLYADGTVIALHDHEEQRDLAKLSAEIVNGVTAEIENLPDETEIIDTRPGTPICYDAPSTTFRAYKAGKALEIAGRSGCHDYALRDGSASRTINVLRALQTLSQKY